MAWPPKDNAANLSGDWLVRPDPDGAGVAARWWAGATDPAAWRPVALPCAWQTVLGHDFHDVAWFRRRVTIPLRWRLGRRGHRLWLRFQAVATDCRAWVNGVEVGRHVGDYVPFQFDVTDAAGAARQIEIVMRVDEVHAAPPSAEGDLQNGHITKGFHDVISLQHGGVWQPVHLARTRRLCAIPDGVSVIADADTRTVRIDVALEVVPGRGKGLVKATVEAMGLHGVKHASTTLGADERAATLTLKLPEIARWSPEKPRRYLAVVELRNGPLLSERHVITFGFRTVKADDRTIRLNGRPLFLRGMLDWGHEPNHIAPAPTDEEVRARFTHLKRMGFNCVCLCMWYAPRRFYDIADEMGMLIWQEHPVWQSPMGDEHVAEYQRLYEAFMRRDVNHPSVIIVSATCEHPAFHPDLADWWWRTARAKLPDRLLQLQTAFFRWADAKRTDLHDEHTYDNSNRWVRYVEDVQHHLESLPPRPFVMGETILFTSWPDLEGIAANVGDERPWWLPRAFDHRRELEAQWTERYGQETVERFRRQGDRFHLLGRKFQFEQLRRFPGNAGAVMNHLRDVPACACGFMDDLGDWRLHVEESRPWLSDRALLLWTPHHRRSFARATDGETLRCELAVSNFASRPFNGAITVRSRAKAAPPTGFVTGVVECPPGQVRAARLDLPLPNIAHPSWVQLKAEADGGAMNWWDLWVFPRAEERWPRHAARLGGFPFDAADQEPDDEERAYSRGWGLPVRDFTCLPPDPAVLAPELPAVAPDAAPPDGVRCVLTHRLTKQLVDWMEAGGRIVLLASKAPGGLGTRYEWLFGQVPLVIEEGPFEQGDSEWIVDLLGYDLTRRYCRVIPVEELGIAEQVDPLIRLVYTHDQERVKLFDMLFQARVGAGFLMVSSLDHSEAAGQYLLRRVACYAACGESSAHAHLDPQIVRQWTLEHTASRPITP